MGVARVRRLGRRGRAVALSFSRVVLLPGPVTLVACRLAGRSARSWLELLGALAGAGLVCLGIAFGARDYSPCPPGGSLRVSP